MNEAATTSRAVMAFIADAGIDVELCSVDIAKGEHHGAEFARINPNRMIPVLEDDGFVLTESSAILRYLAGKSGSPLYPTELRARARVDELMAWFEANFYKDFGFQFVYPQLFAHHSRGSDAANRATVEFGRASARSRLGVLNDHYLGDERVFLTGEQRTIADYHGASILSLGDLVGMCLDAYPRVKRWYDTVSGLEHWSSVNQAFQGFAASLRSTELVGLS
jgi:glutathione S-transferase